MNSKIIMATVLIIFMVCINGCTVNTNSGYAGYNNAIYDMGPNEIDIDFNHDSAVGYGGVNVYN